LVLNTVLPDKNTVSYCKHGIFLCPGPDIIQLISESSDVGNLQKHKKTLFSVSRDSPTKSVSDYD
jgi:hypothetical protein